MWVPSPSTWPRAPKSGETKCRADKFTSFRGLPRRLHLVVQDGENAQSSHRRRKSCPHSPSRFMRASLPSALAGRCAPLEPRLVDLQVKCRDAGSKPSPAASPFHGDDKTSDLRPVGCEPMDGPGKFQPFGGTDRRASHTAETCAISP